MENIYLDHAATTPTDPEVIKAMLPYFSEIFANPESNHTPGHQAKKAVDDSRTTISKILNCSPLEIIFTGSGTESNNLAIFGIAKANLEKRHIITTKIEHSSILEPLRNLEKQGYKITYLNVNKDGEIDLQELKSKISDKTLLVSIIHANNEIGTIQDIKSISKITKKHNIPLHIDSCQATPFLKLDTKELGIDLMTINSSKIYGPKGVGLLFKKDNIKIEPLIYGGEQEFGIRSGTLNTPAIVGFTKALELAQENHKEEFTRLRKIQKHFLEKMTQDLPEIKLNGSIKNRLPNNLNIQVKNINNKELILHLDNLGVFVSTGSACSSKKELPSHVLIATGLKEEQAQSSIRISMGKKTVEKDINYLLECLQNLTKKLH